MKTKHYDIFISYRREGGFETADAIKERLKSAGYSVFFDIEKLRAGKFNEQLFQVIEGCKDFLIILPENEANRLNNEDDWVRQEVECALKNKKNIIPVMLRGFKWPDNLPDSIAELPNYQGIAAGDYNYFDASMDKLKSYLKSKKGFTFRRYRTVIYAFLAVLVVLCGILGYKSYKENSLYKTVCIEQAKRMAGGMSAIDLNLTTALDAKKEWGKFYSKFQIANDKQKDQLRKDFSEYIQYSLNNIVENNSLYKLDVQDAMILQKKGVPQEEIDAFYEMALPSSIKETQEYLERLLQYSEQKLITEQHNQFAELLGEEQIHANNVVYYCLLELFTYFPDDIYSSDFNKLRATWTNFSQISVRLPREEYESLAESEFKKCENIISELGGSNLESERELIKMEQELKNMEEEHLLSQERKKAEMEKTITNIAEKQQGISIKEGEVAEAEKKLAEEYEKALEKFKLSPDDNQWAMWGKVIRIGWLANNTKVNRANEEKQMEALRQKAINNGTDPSIFTKRNHIYSVDDMFGYVDNWLDTYYSYQKENDANAQIYIPAAKKYYQSVKLNEIPYAGIIVFAIENNAEHPFLKVGDIVMERKGEVIRNPEHYASLSDKAGDNKLKVYRLTDGRWSIIEDICPQSDIRLMWVDLAEQP